MNDQEWSPALALPCTLCTAAKPFTWYSTTAPPSSDTQIVANTAATQNLRFPTPACKLAGQARPGHSQRRRREGFQRLQVIRPLRCAAHSSRLEPSKFTSFHPQILYLNPKFYE
jgi:hypothetical protein